MPKVTVSVPSVLVKVPSSLPLRLIVLPLTVNPRVSRELGTRHRAAIGLTEECDAVAVVVSEETGAISLALDGRIERQLTADQLRARLRSLVLMRRSGSRNVGARYDV